MTVPDNRQLDAEGFASNSLSRSQQRWRRLTKVGAGTTLILGLAVVGIGVGGRSYVQRQLLPEVEATLEATLQRQVTLGDVKFVWPWQVSLGESEIEQLAIVRGIDIRADVWRWLWQRELAIALRLHHPKVTIQQSSERGWANLDLNLDGMEGMGAPLSSVTLEVANGHLNLIPLEGESHQFERWQGRLLLPLGSEEEDVSWRTKLRVSGALLQIEGSTALPISVSPESSVSSGPSLQLQASGTELPVTLLDLLPLQNIVQAQEGTADVELQVHWQPDRPLEFAGTAIAHNVTFAVNSVPLPFEDFSGPIALTPNSAILQKVEGRYGQIPISVEGTVDWEHPIYLQNWTALKQAQFNLVGESSGVKVAQLEETFGLTVPVPVSGVAEGQASLMGPVTNPLLQGEFQQTEVATVSRLEVDKYSGNFALQGNRLELTELAASLPNDGGRATGSGQVFLRESPIRSEFQFDLKDADVSQIVAAYEFDPLPKSLGGIDAQGTVTIAGDRPVIIANWQAKGGEITGTGRFDWREDQSTIPQADIALGGGTALFSAVLTPATADGVRAFSARIIPEGVAVNFLATDLISADLLSGEPHSTGDAEAAEVKRLNGDIQIDGTTRDVSLAGLEASGRIEFPTGLASLPGPMAAQVDWDGSELTIRDGLALDTVAVDGRIPFDPLTKQVGDVDLKLAVRSLPLAELPQLPPNFPVSGLVNLDGRLRGTPSSFELVGQLGLDNFQAAGLKFSSLQGPLRWKPGSEGVEIDLRDPTVVLSDNPDVGDRLAISLDGDWIPQDFALRQGETSADGQRDGERFDVTLAQFPLALMNGIVPGVWNGTIDSTLSLNMAENTAQGRLTTTSSSWQGIKVDRLQGNFALGGDKLVISNGELQLRDSLYRADGTIWLPSAPQRTLRGGRRQSTSDKPLRLDLQVATDNASVEGLLQAVRWQDWQDMTAGLPAPQFGSASLLQVPAISLLQQSLFDRLETYSVAVRQQAEQFEQQLDPRIPNIANLRGSFGGIIQISGALAQPAIDFDLTGANWQLPPSKPNDGQQAYQLDRLVAKGRYQSQTLQLDRFEATSGDRRGSLTGTFGRKDQTGFLLLNRFPIQLLENFVPNAPSFSGDLNASAEISGTHDNPEASGRFDLANITINDNPLQVANGTFTYNQATLQLEGNLQGDAPNPVILSGVLPLPLPFVTVQPPSEAISLAVVARDEQLALMNLFTDEFTWRSGQGVLDISLGGTLQAPTLSGGIDISDGVLEVSALPQPIQQLNAAIAFNSDRLNVQALSGTYGDGQVTAAGGLAVNSEGLLRAGETPLVVKMGDLNLELPDLYKGELAGTVEIQGTMLLPELSGNVVLQNGTISIPSNDNSRNQQWQPRFNGLTLTLADNVQVARPPLFSIVTRGDLALYGTLSALQPEGTISIEQGRLNLGLTNLRIDRGRDNTVVFDRQGGFDPVLNVSAFTEVQETRGRGVTTTRSFTSSGSNETVNLTEQQTVQIQALVQGRASELNAATGGSNLIQLSSSPSRSPDEIVALLGGAQIDGLGRGNLAGFALSTVLFGAQNALGNALGLDELRVAPFAGDSGSLGVGVEAAKDLGAGVSVSVQQSLNDPNENPRLSTRFRVSDNVLIRTGTNFDGNDRASFEFSTDF